MKKIVLGSFFLFCFFYGSQAQIINGDFEDWHHTFWGYEDPDDWATSNSYPFIQTIKDTVEIYRGNYSLRLENKFSPHPYLHSGFNLLQHPTFLSAFVKLSLADSNDTVSVKIILYANTVVVDSGIGYYTSSIGNYTSIKIPISQSSLISDSAQIKLIGGANHNIDNEGTKFWIDDLSLDYGNDILEFEMSQNNIIVSPNPSKDNFTISFSESVHEPSIMIFNNLEEQVFEKNVSGVVKEILVHFSAAAGIYFLKIREGERERVVKIAVE